MSDTKPEMRGTTSLDNFTSDEIDHLKFFRHIQTDLTKEEFAPNNIQTPATIQAESILKESRPIDLQKVLEIRESVLGRLFSDSKRKVDHPPLTEGSLLADFSSTRVASGVHADNFQIDAETISRRSEDNSDVERTLVIKYNEIINDETKGQVAYFAQIDPRGQLKLRGYAQIGKEKPKVLNFDSSQPNYTNDIEPQTALDILSHISRENVRLSTPK